mgnify:CR=1 FL=1
MSEAIVETLKHSGNTGTANLTLASSGAVTTADDLTVGDNLVATKQNGCQRIILEQFLCPCDGTVMVLNQGNTTIADSSSVQQLTTSYVDLAGSEISYTPPTGTTQVIYEFVLHCAGKDAHGIGTIRTYLDDVEVTDAIFSFGASSYFDSRICHRWAFNIGGTAVAASGRVASWTSAKTIKMKGREYGGSNEAQVFGTRYTDNSGSTTFSRPSLGITAIG